jgi:hypothetical protein
MSTIKIADQGVRQPAVVKRNLPADVPGVLLPGRIIINMRYVNRPEEQTIPEGCIGIVHEADKQISIVRDDCKAARKAINAAKLVASAAVKDVSHKAESKSKVTTSLQPTTVSYTLKERTLKQHTLTDACAVASAILENKYQYKKLCTDLLKGRNEADLLTTEEMSNLAQELVDDTLYYAGAFTSAGPLA